MAFLDDYEPVEDRLRAFWSDHPEGRIETELVGRTAGDVVFKASVWRKHFISPSDVPPTATGFAQETVTERGVNATSALENCETSAIGRALANLGYAAKGKRPSREEMSKASAPPPGVDRPAVDNTILPAGNSPGEVASSDAYGEGVSEQTASLGPNGSPEGVDAIDPASAPSGHRFTVLPKDCSHTADGDWATTIVLDGKSRCPYCGTPALRYRESTTADLGPA